jgi:hypothetical protein
MTKVEIIEVANHIALLVFVVIFLLKEWFKS